MNPNTADKTSYIYIIGTADGPVKIGHSFAPTQRASQLSKIDTRRYIVMGTWPVGYGRALAVERYTHWLLRDRHFRGEWFNVSRQEAATAIERAIAQPVDEGYPIPAVDTRSRDLVGGDYMRTRFPKGMKERVHAVSGGDHSQFIRDAVEAELQRREKPKT